MIDPSWSAQDLSRNLCDRLVAKGQLKDKPAFIRSDREALITDIFVQIGLDGGRMCGFTNCGPMETMVRKGTAGQAWVDQVIVGLKEMLPPDVANAAVVVCMEESTKEALAEARERSKAKMERQSQFGKGDRNGKGGFKGGNDECFNCGGFGHMARDCPMPKGSGKGKGGGGGGGGECYNCGGFGHLARDCPESPRKGGKGGKGKGGKGRGKEDRDVSCYNCGGMGHMSRECPAPRRGKGDGKFGGGDDFGH